MITQKPSQRTVEAKRIESAHVGDDPRDGLTFQPMPGGNECGDIGRLHLIEDRDVP